MMFGFGDDQNPYTESVDLLEDLVIEYITEMVYIYFIQFGLIWHTILTEHSNFHDIKLESWIIWFNDFWLVTIA